MVKSFDSFVSENYSYYNPLEGQVDPIYPYGADMFHSRDFLKLHESKAMCNLSLDDFRSILHAPLLESEGYVDDFLVESLHACYEFNQMFESRPSWFTDPNAKKFMMETDEHRIYIFEGEIYIVSKRSFQTIESINEGFWGDVWDYAKNMGNKVATQVKTFVSKRYEDAKAVVKKVVNKTGEVVKKVTKSVSDVWDTISSGAKKAWTWCKDSVATAWNIVKSSTPLQIASGIISVIGAVAGWLAAIGGTVLAAICTAITGAIDLVEGGMDVYKGAQIIKKASITTDESGAIDLNSVIQPATSSIPLLCMGSVGMVLGFSDIAIGIANALVNPAAGSFSLALKNTAKKASKNWIAKIAKKIKDYVSNFIGVALKKVIPGGKVTVLSAAAVNKIKAEAGSVLSTKNAARLGKAVIGTEKKVVKGQLKDATDSVKESISEIIQLGSINAILPWLWGKILKAGKAVTDGINFIVSIPEKLSNGISNISKNAKGTIETILAKGLTSIVKPLTDAASNLVNKSIKPSVQSAQKWIDTKIKLNDAVLKAFSESKQPSDSSVPVTSPKSAIKVETLKAEKGDLQKIESLPPVNKALKKAAQEAPVVTGSKGKVKESLDVSSGFRVMGFDDFSLAY